MRDYLNIDRPAAIVNTLQAKRLTKRLEIGVVKLTNSEMSFQEYLEIGFVEYFGIRERLSKNKS